jgi:hypothetical protein
LTGCQWLIPANLATQEEDIRRITFPSQPGQIVCKALSWKTLHQSRTGRVAQGIGPEFKLQYKKKKKSISRIMIFQLYPNREAPFHHCHSITSQIFSEIKKVEPCSLFSLCLCWNLKVYSSTEFLMSGIKAFNFRIFWSRGTNFS